MLVVHFNVSSGSAREFKTSNFSTPIDQINDYVVVDKQQQHMNGKNQHMLQNVCMEVMQLVKSKGTQIKGHANNAMARNLQFAGNLSLCFNVLNSSEHS